MRGRAVKERRRREAEERQAERDRRGDEGQLNRLIDKGHGHCKEVQRLRDRMTQRVNEEVSGA
jgi:hypothetical protein